MRAVLKRNGSDGQFELTGIAKIAATVLVALLTASALGALNSYVKFNVMEAAMAEMKSDLNDKDRHGVGALEYQDLRDEVMMLKGVVSAISVMD